MRFVVFIIFLGLSSYVLFGQCSSELVKSQIEIANENKLKNPEVSFNAAKSALECAEKLEVSRYISYSLNVIGFHHLMEGNTKEAYQDFIRSMDAATDLQNDTVIAIAQNNLGNYYNYLGLDKLALDYYLESLRIKRKAKWEEGVDVALVNIGMIYDKQGKHKKALECYEEALLIKESKNDDYGIGLVLENIGIAHAELHNFEAANMSFDQANDIYHKIQYDDGILAIKLSKAALMLDKKDILGSGSQLTDIEEEIINGKDIVKIQIWYSTASKVQFSDGQFGIASKLADSALTYAKRMNDLQTIGEAYNSLATIMTESGEKLKGLNYTNKALKIKDSLNTLSNLAAIEELQLRYETEVLNNKIEIQNKDIVLLNSENRNRTYIIFLILLISALVITIIVRRYWSSLKQKRHLRVELDQRNKELLSFTVQTAKKNEAIQRLKDSFSNEGTGQISNEREVRSLFKEIERTEDDWQEFRMRFEQIEPKFFQVLSEKYRLSETDLRICALIKLNVTTQEAANMLNITNESVNKARYRLRKKLDLPKEIELNSFIRNYS